MSKTNCVNCGAAKEVDDLQCPFCGTKYADLTTFDLFHDKEIFIQFTGANGAVKTAKAYITETTLQMHPETMCLYGSDNFLHRETTALHVNGSINFALYESV